MPYKPQNKIRMVTTASLFDGHDAAINIMRRILQSIGVEVIHLGHNRSASDIVETAIQEDVQAVCISSYQGGHMEFFTYVRDLLRERNCGHIRIFGGGGGTILPGEIAELEKGGITRVYSPDDGRKMGLEGMIGEVVSLSDFQVPVAADLIAGICRKDARAIASAITLLENDLQEGACVRQLISENGDDKSVVLGITGTGGAGKSTVTDELLRRLLENFPDKTVAVLSVDPSRKKTGGALLGDRIRMNALPHPRAYMRSMATRGTAGAAGEQARGAIALCRKAGFDLVILETPGIGQADTTLEEVCDLSVYVMTPEYGAASQLEKINMLDFADVVALNKSDKAGAADALREIRKQYRRNHGLWSVAEEEIPVVATMASRFNDPGMDRLFALILERLKERTGPVFSPPPKAQPAAALGMSIIPPSRVRYLAEITEAIAARRGWENTQCEIASRLYQIRGAARAAGGEEADAFGELSRRLEELGGRYQAKLDPESRQLLDGWEALKERYRKEYLEYGVRDKIIRLPLQSTTLSGTLVPKVALPAFSDWGDILRWRLEENVPGEFPYTAGVFLLKREGEDPTRMFAGEGSPERTNRRFHYLYHEQPAKRLSTAFDSVTLYGRDPGRRPDIYGKVGNAGVSIATVDDAKKLYSGFDLCDPATSVSMTINGPAPVILAFFLNAAIDQQCEKHITAHGLWEDVKAKLKGSSGGDDAPRYHDGDGLPAGHDGLGLRLLGVSGDQVLDDAVYRQISAAALSTVRGTVQADILKEDQAQNTCIFSTDFALRMMGDVQEFFIAHQVHNFYSVSISGYHIAEAGANPITQLAFTLANGFTYVEYYLSRGMAIDDFAPNLSFFFSNGMDAEYAVIGRVARRIWARAMKYKYGANERSRKLKYHVQTSGRSLHAQEIDFNDIRTTLQALYALYDNCNSLHTNAYDEAITTPTEESVRRAMAIQLIIARELGTAKNENPLQGSFLIRELTDLVEEAVLAEFNRISERGGVPGAMERMYQRSRIQEESLYYESLKNKGTLPVVGVNTFLNSKGSPTVIPGEVIRSTEEEKERQINNLRAFQQRHAPESDRMLRELQHTARSGGNIFSSLMETVKHCSLGQITEALFAVGGEYRRNM
jgi:methylmalonyl-CoA mutase